MCKDGNKGIEVWRKYYALFAIIFKPLINQRCIRAVNYSKQTSRQKVETKMEMEKGAATSIIKKASPPERLFRYTRDFSLILHQPERLHRPIHIIRRYLIYSTRQTINRNRYLICACCQYRSLRMHQPSFAVIQFYQKRRACVSSNTQPGSRLRRVGPKFHALIYITG